MRGFLVTACAALALSACDDGASAVETRDRAADATGGVLTAASAEAVPAETVAKVEAAPITANRRETVDAKVQRLYERNGADFGAASAEDYLAKVTAFTRNPPAGVERAERPNGDVLLYQASTNTFAVVDRNGSARTMFKPREGAAYWAEQKANAPTFGRRRAD
ncbi:MAG TPA: S-type pyocin family protein [Brevundimonas sp.]|jgi:pyocin large subunit-like protein|uniref:S-type pyocin family protein n=1 Tax=Brevundimonas sp. TaxID=1871086 RepID=UPI002DF3805A|nr:S-type pyocin family protein [Brevundimonas sp.]